MSKDDNHVRRATRPTQLGMAEPNGWDRSEANVQRRQPCKASDATNVVGHGRAEWLGQERSECPKTTTM